MPPYNYLLFDAARAKSGLIVAMDLNPNFQSLYRGTAEEELAHVAPYLFSIQNETPLANWYFKEGAYQSWGTLLYTPAPFEEVYRHFRKFLMVQTEDKKPLYFRFYDPRVLRIFLPTCDKAQIMEFFGPVKIFICENEDPNYITIFSHTHGSLVVDTRKNSMLQRIES